MKKIYITGLAGLLGSNLAYLLKDEYQIFGCDRNNVNMDGITHACYDVLMYNRIEQEILEIKPEVVINTAALVNVDLCESEKALADDMNRKLPNRLSSVCSQLGSHLIQISTDAVYKDIPNELHTEKTLVEPKNWYGKTKYEGESKVLSYHKGTVLRTNIYGFNIRNKESFGEWILKAFQSKQALNMVTDVMFSPILVNDLTKVVNEVIKKNIYGLYNVCATGAISKYDFGIYMREIFGYENAVINKITSTELNLSASRSKNMGMSNMKLKSIIETKLRTPKESIEEFYRLETSGYAQALKKFGGIDVWS